MNQHVEKSVASLEKYFGDYVKKQEIMFAIEIADLYSFTYTCGLEQNSKDLVKQILLGFSEGFSFVLPHAFTHSSNNAFCNKLLY